MPADAGSPAIARRAEPVGGEDRARADATTRTAASRPRRLLAVQTVLCFAALVAVAIAACVFVDRLAKEQHREVLQRRSGEVATLLTSALGEVRSSLGVLVSVSGPSDEAAFTKASEALVQGAVRVVARADREQGDFVIAAGHGDARIGEIVSGDRFEVLRRALGTDDVVTGVVQAEEGAGLMYALADPTGTRVVFREATINPLQVSSTVRGQAFDDLETTVYATPDPEEQALVLTTTASPLVDGVATELPVGADTWLLVTSPRGQLQGAIDPNSKWVVLAFGLTVAFATAALVETLARRRGFALQLVERRTADLERALEERSLLEAGQRSARQDAEAANLAKSEFLSRMSHELRTPLNGVLGFAQLLEMEPLTEQQRESVRHITKAGWHLLGLINEVLDMSRIEAGTVALSPEPVLASEVLTESLDLIGPMAREHNVHVTGGSASDCDVYVYADRQRVKQILLNLMSNAIKYNRPGGSMSVRCGASGSTMRISVTDTGFGIAAEQLDLLFVPFERLGAEQRDIEGTGIGLSLSRRLAEAMAGTVTVESVVGKGSTFHLELPLVEGQVERFVRLGPTVAEPATTAGPPPAARKLLYIEDNLSNLRLVERLLESRSDIEVVAAMQGQLGLDLTRQHAPFAVLLDLHLPDIDGAEVLRQLRDDPATRSVPVVILSADATPGQIGRLLAEGAYAYLTKPLDVRELLQVLDTILAADD